MSSFILFAAEKVAGLVTSLANKTLGDKVKDILTQRKMKRLVEDAVDRIIGQSDEYLTAEKASEPQKEILITCLCDKLQPLADEPQRFFAGDMNGAKLFDQCHPNGELPEAIRHEGLGQFYSLLFPQIAHFVAGSKVALAQWQAEGFREGFRRLSDIAEEIRIMNVKVTSLPGAVVQAMQSTAEGRAETLLHEFAQTLFNNLQIRLDLSPLRAERSLYGSLSDHFVVPQFRERRDKAEAIGNHEVILAQLCSPGSRRIVHGGAGVGKTTCALWLQSCLLQGKASRLAILIRLRSEPGIESLSLLDLLRKQAGAHLRDSLTDEMLRGWHEAGRLAIILDGFDEVPEARRDAVEKWIKDLGISARKSSLIVTSRPLQSGHLEKQKAPWQQWDLLPFDEQRIIEFIQRWHRHLPDGELSAAERQVDATSLAQTFLKDPSLKPLADTPLMLGTLLYVHHRDKKLPSGRVDLYERYITAMLGLRDSGLSIEARSTKLADHEKRRVLAHIALHFHWNGVNEANDETMHALVTEALQRFGLQESADCLLPALCERTGLMQGPGSWSFMHKTIGEFLVAGLICDGSTFLPNGTRLDRQELWQHRHDDPWTAVLFFWAGKTSAKELEEFVFELVKEPAQESPLLALAVLGDQGDRLERSVQRELALAILRREWADCETLGGAVASTGCVPSLFFHEEQCSLWQLRGLSGADSVRISMGLFAKGVVALSDVQGMALTNRRMAMIAALWALDEPDGSVALRACMDLCELPRDRLALLLFEYAVGYPLLERNDSTKLAEWMDLFPESSAWVAFLLMGVWQQKKDDVCGKTPFQQWLPYMGPLLWKYHVHPVAEAWLKHSFEWNCWANSMPGDVLQQFYDAFVSGPASAWGLREAQHQDLVIWLQGLLKRRMQLAPTAP